MKVIQLDIPRHQDGTPLSQLELDIEAYINIHKDIEGVKWLPQNFHLLNADERARQIDSLYERGEEDDKAQQEEYQEDLVHLQSFGNFTEKQLVAWGCL